MSNKFKLVNASFESLFMRDEYAFLYKNKIEIDPRKVTKISIAVVTVTLKKHFYDLFIKIMDENFTFSDEKDH